MWYRFLANALVVFHLCFVLFVLFGGLLVVRWRWVALLHVPAALWGMLVEWTGWMCPLTPLENSLREMGGGVPYEGGFIDHYIVPVLPAAPTPVLPVPVPVPVSRPERFAPLRSSAPRSSAPPPRWVMSSLKAISTCCVTTR